MPPVGQVLMLLNRKVATEQWLKSLTEYIYYASWNKVMVLVICGEIKEGRFPSSKAKQERKLEM